MISLSLQNIGKRFSREWIFRGLSYDFKVGQPVAIIGPNGSGKSTLIKALSGTIPVNEGSVNFYENDKPIDEENWHSHVGISAPYLELIEEFTLAESIAFHSKFRHLDKSINIEEFMKMIGLEKHRNKYVRDFSSGMKQKLKLGFAFFSQNSILILDEPTANIDHNGYEWYMEMVQSQINDKIVIISSNEPKEYTFCKESISILDYKS